MQKNHAFTLAEVLITLGIIGVVCALTIPTLMYNAQKNAYISGAVKYQNVLQSAVNKYKADNSYDNLIQADIFNNGASYTRASSKRVWDDLKEYFIFAKDCSGAASQGCFANNLKYINGNTPGGCDGSPDSCSAYIDGILNDGVTVFFGDAPGNCNYNRSISGAGDLITDCGFIFMDINGLKNPNQYGRDIFGYRILASGKVIPMGTTDDYAKGCDPTSTDVSPGADGSPGIGGGCTSIVISEGVMNY